jgi:hypothetical protein
MSRGPWPTPTYARRRALKAERRAERERVAANYASVGIRPDLLPIREAPKPRGLNVAQRLITSWYAAGDLARAVQRNAAEIAQRARLERQYKRDNRIPA